MSQIATTKMSSRGQIVIPQSVREEAGFKPGDQFVVMRHEDSVVLKRIHPPATNFMHLLPELRKRAGQAGLTRSELARMVREARKSH
jgi:AbrB family looped-hinge helix DNA binding protein